jgi:hypothetical protein
MTDQVLLDPLRGEVFRLSAYISSAIVSGFQRSNRSNVPTNEYTIASMLYDSRSGSIVSVSVEGSSGATTGINNSAELP